MKRRTKYELVPLSGGFMLTGMLGFTVVTVYTLYGRIPAAWGFAFDLVFLMMFIASVVSVTPTFPSQLNQRI